MFHCFGLTGGVMLPNHSPLVVAEQFADPADIDDPERGDFPFARYRIDVVGRNLEVTDLTVGNPATNVNPSDGRKIQVAMPAIALRISTYCPSDDGGGVRHW